MFQRFAAIVTRYWYAVILGWVALAWGINHVAPVWDHITQDGDLVYLPGRMTTIRGLEVLAQAFPNTKANSQMVLVVERPGMALAAADFAVTEDLSTLFRDLVVDGDVPPSDDPAWRRQVTADYAQLLGTAPDALSSTQRATLDALIAAFRPAAPLQPPLVEVWDRGDEVVGEKLTSAASKNGQASLVLLHLTTEFMTTSNMQLLAAVNHTLDMAAAAPRLPSGLKLGISGSAAIGADTLTSAQESITNIELTTVVLVLAILMFVYRAPLLVLITLATMVVSVMVAVDFVAALTQVSWLDFKIFKTTKIFVVVILFGAGTDYCLFLIARYREELNRGLDKHAAVTTALGQVGHAVVGSALTVVFGLGMMYFADFGKFRYSGPAIAMCLSVCLVACLTLTPALLRAAGPWVFWPWGLKRSSNAVSSGDETEDEDEGSRFWRWAADKMLARPGLILTVSVLLMAPFAWIGRDVPISYDLLTDLAPHRASVLGTQMLRRHFDPGDIGPATVIAHLPGTNFDTPAGRRMITDLSKQLAAIPGVAKVRSLTQPTGDPPRRYGLSGGGLRRATIKVHPRTRAAYLTQVPELAGSVTRFDLVFRTDPFARASVALLNTVDEHLKEITKTKSSPWHKAEFDFVGTTPGIRDLEAVVHSDTRLIQKLVVIAVLGVLIVLVRQPLLCLYLIISVVFSYLVTIGATELVFGWIYGETFAGMDWKAPLFLFVILIAVGEDYNIFLTTRIVEEQARHGLHEGLREAVVRTGGIITSCGLIMAGSFLSMLTGTLRGMLELGFALSLGVILDTFVVRPVLVPCFLALVYRLRGHLHAPPQPAGVETKTAPSKGAPARNGEHRPHAPTRSELPVS
ncbi:MAG: MMPL family transporter [Pirellulales bacterium]|nr:MMPL family transporter [Pirellulales bacterium]